jgi:hypothetical protein
MGSQSAGQLRNNLTTHERGERNDESVISPQSSLSNLQDLTRELTVRMGGTLQSLRVLLPLLWKEVETPQVGAKFVEANNPNRQVE